MCVALPGKIESISDKTAMVDFSGNKVKVYTGLTKVKVGDYALVHAGCVIQTLKASEAEELIDLMNGIG